ncbi:hypothetical protein ACFL27_22935 [candidate division CSSED10-310 bacterium]|uniref:Shikimate kinase n=1 Tax=candidate division CSSED10-310 bacterium TaxID=2855610 RepID=A0ABV6Z3T4_UNCC1
MIITLIGMSNCGKSYWSKKLETIGFERICCDDEIEKKLGLKLNFSGARGIEAVARWMGQPYEPEAEKNQALYLALEKEVMTEIFQRLPSISHDFVIDTTGSIIYAGHEMCHQLKILTTTVHLKITDTMLEQMISRYFTDPKPLIWGDHFQPYPGENMDHALRRCYRALLHYRLMMYEKYATISIDCFRLQGEDISTHSFLDLIK